MLRLSGPAMGERPIALAVSGGGDSMAMLTMAAQWARDSQRQLICLSVDHGLRAASSGECEQVSERCAALSVAHRTLRWSAPRRQQASARRARHALLSEAARAAGARVILLGHTRDDNEETFLMRARQGSGWFGLGGLDPVSPSPVWPQGRSIMLARPLLSMRREELRDALRRQTTGWIDDPSNDNCAFERVRMRRLLECEPDVRDAVTRCLGPLARLRRAELSRLAHLIGVRVGAHSDSSLSLDASGLPPGVLTRLLSQLLRVAGGHDRTARTRGLTRLSEAICAGDDLPGRTLCGVWIAGAGCVIRMARDPGAVNRSDADDIWDGRFKRATNGTVAGHPHPMTRASLPPSSEDWRALNDERLGDLVNCWQKLALLS